MPEAFVHQILDSRKLGAAASMLGDRIWSQLPQDLALRVLSFLPPNEVACSARPLCKAAAAHFSAPQHLTVRLSQPVPPEAYLQHWSQPGAVRCLTFEKRRQLVLLTVGSGSSPANVVVALGAARLSPDDPEIFRAAARSGSRETCELLCQLECGVCPYRKGWEILNAAAAAGHQALCEWAHVSLGVPWVGPISTSPEMSGKYNAMDAAGWARQLALCQTIHDKYGVPYTAAVIEAAAGQGDLELCRFLLGLGIGGDEPMTWRHAFHAAALAGHTSVCSWMVSEGLLSVVTALRGAFAAVSPQLVSQLLASHQDRAPWQWWPDLLAAAAWGCDLTSLQGLLRRGPTAVRASSCGGGDSVNGSSVYGSNGGVLTEIAALDILSKALNSPTDDWREKAEWLMAEPSMRLAHRRRFEERGGLTIEERRSAGEPLEAVLERLLWLCEQHLIGQRGVSDLLYDGLNVVEQLAAAGNITALETFLDAGLGTAQTAAHSAAGHGHWAALLWLQSRGARVGTAMVVDVVQALDGAASSCTALAELLAALGPTVVLTREVTQAAVATGRVELVEWLLELGCRLDEGDWGCAAEEAGCEAMLELLAERDCPRAQLHRIYASVAERGDLATLGCLRRLGLQPSEPIDVLHSAPLPALRWLAQERLPVRLHHLPADDRAWVARFPMDLEEGGALMHWLANVLRADHNAA